MTLRVCVLGLGQIGLPTTKYIAEKGLDVQGYDISEAAVKRAKDNGIKATTEWHEVQLAEVYVICVSTLLKGDEPDLAPIFDVCEKISEKAEPESLVSVESTIIPGTCRKVYKEIFNGGVTLIHVPHRYWSENSAEYGVRQKRIMGTINEESMEKGLSFYRDRLEIPLHIVPSIEIAEMAKVAENAYRYVQIAFAEELKMICEKLGLDFENVREACNTKWNIEILEARDGIGGHCLPKEIRYLASLSEYNTLSRSAMAVDAAYRDYLKKHKGK
jgi:UDP-N-acetyl-D-mannosaminuronic acid dehydrogenase